MKRIIPTRVVETGRVVRGPSGQPTGWLQSFVERAQNLRAQIQGINERIRSPLTHGVPACVMGEQLFKADLNKTITITDYPTDPDANPPAAFTTLTVNPIIYAGRTYRIPIVFPPPGVFEAHNLVVGIEAGYTMFANRPQSGITPLNDYRQIGTLNTLAGFLAASPASDAIQYTWQQQVLGDFTTIMPFLPYFWNIVDEKSGRQYAQDWMPCGALLNTRGNNQDRTAQVSIPDSELFEFDTPWLFERDGQVAFQFRPIMDLYQVAAADAQEPYGGVDDLSAGRRQEQALVRVEFHGNRYYTAQDTLRDGARV